MVPKKEKTANKRLKTYLNKVMTEELPNLGKQTHIQVQKVQRIQTRPKRPTPIYIIIKVPKIKDKENLKNSKRKAFRELQGSSHKTVR